MNPLDCLILSCGLVETVDKRPLWILLKVDGREYQEPFEVRILTNNVSCMAIDKDLRFITFTPNFLQNRERLLSHSANHDKVEEIGDNEELFGDDYDIHVHPRVHVDFQRMVQGQERIQETKDEEPEVISVVDIEAIKLFLGLMMTKGTLLSLMSLVLKS